MNGKNEQQITKGNWEVTKIVAIQQKRKKNTIYYISTEDSPLERSLYSIRINGKNKTKLFSKRGTTNAHISKDFQFYVRYHSNATQPLQVDLMKIKNDQLIKTLKDNARLKEIFEEYQIDPPTFFTVPTADGALLNAYMLKPRNFDETKKYPVLMFQYSGPQSQQVANRWNRSHYYWHQMLTQKGYIVACVDSRGTGYRGAEFTKITYQNLGKMEVADNIEMAKFLQTLDYVDENRIGIWGWSYGGYMSSLLMMIGADYFKTGIAVAPTHQLAFLRYHLHRKISTTPKRQSIRI